VKKNNHSAANRQSGSDRLRIQPVPVSVARCFICARIGNCSHVDLDFRGAPVCDHCSGFVIIAEVNLRNAGLSIPTDSIMEKEEESGNLETTI
jgi:hypothetical protein